MSARTYSLRQAFTKSNGNVQRAAARTHPDRRLPLPPRRAAIKGTSAMITSKNRITRGRCCVVPGESQLGFRFLEAMLWPGTTHAAATTPFRLVIFYSPGGTLLDQVAANRHRDQLHAEQHDGPAQSLQGSPALLRRARLKITANRRGSSPQPWHGGRSYWHQTVARDIRDRHGFGGLRRRPVGRPGHRDPQQHGSEVSRRSSSRRVGRSRVARRARCRSPPTNSPMLRRTNRSHRK